MVNRAGKEASSLYLSSHNVFKPSPKSLELSLLTTLSKQHILARRLHIDLVVIDLTSILEFTFGAQEITEFTKRSIWIGVHGKA